MLREIKKITEPLARKQFTGKDLGEIVIVSGEFTDLPEAVFSMSICQQVWITAPIETISFGAFYGSKVSVVCLPSTIKKIAAKVFFDCNNLLNIVVLGSKQARTSIAKLLPSELNDKVIGFEQYFAKLIQCEFEVNRGLLPRSGGFLPDSAQSMSANIPKLRANKTSFNAKPDGEISELSLGKAVYKLLVCQLLH